MVVLYCVFKMFNFMCLFIVMSIGIRRHELWCTVGDMRLGKCSVIIIYVHVYMCACICMYICVYVCVYMYVYVHIFICMDTWAYLQRHYVHRYCVSIFV